MYPGATIGLFRWNIPTAADQLQQQEDYYYSPSAATACRDYNLPSSTSPYLYTARIALLASICSALIGFVFAALEFMFRRVCCGSMFELAMLFVAQICTSVSFIAFGTKYCTNTGPGRNNICTLGTGGTYNIVAYCCYLVAVIFLCCTPTPEPLFCREEKNDDANNSNRPLPVPRQSSTTSSNGRLLNKSTYNDDETTQKIDNAERQQQYDPIRGSVGSSSMTLPIRTDHHHYEQEPWSADYMNGTP